MARRLAFSKREQIPSAIFEFRESLADEIVRWLEDTSRPGVFVLWIASRRAYVVTAVKVSEPAVAFELAMRWR